MYLSVFTQAKSGTKSLLALGGALNFPLPWQHIDCKLGRSMHLMVLTAVGEGGQG